MNRLSRVSALIALLCVISWAPQGAAQEDAEAKTKLEQARGLYDRGLWDQALTRYDEAFEASSKTSVTRVEAALEYSSLRWERGEYKQATVKLDEAITQAKALKLDGALGRLLLTMGHIETSQGKLAAANKTFKLCVELATEQHDAIYASLCKLNYSLVQRLAGGKGMSDAAIKQEIQTIKNAQTPLSTGMALAKTGELYSRQKAWGQAISMLEQAQTQFESIKNVPASARNRLKLASTLEQSGQYDRAQLELDRAIGPLKQMGHKPALIQAYGLMGALAGHKSQREIAYGHYDKALKLATQINSPQWIANSRLAICELLTTAPIAPQAEAHCAAAYEDFSRIHARELALRAQVKLANIKQASGQWAPAQRLYKSIVKELEGRKNPDDEIKRVLAIQHANLCQVEHVMEATGAMRTCVQAIDSLKGLKDKDMGEYLAASRYAAAFSAMREKRPIEAITHFKEAVALYTARGEQLRLADASLHLGTLLAKVKSKEAEAEATLRGGLTAIAASPQDAQALNIKNQLRLQLAQHMLGQAKYPVAKAELELLIADTSQDLDLQAWAYQGLAQVKLKAQDRAGAIEALELGLKAAKASKDRYGLKETLEQNIKQLKAP